MTSTSETTPLVSVVIPTYNRAATLGSALDSALTQDYPRLDVVVVDDGSTDDTPGLLRSYGSDITLIRQGNRGVAAARNVGIARARGEVLMFLDSDDQWLPRRVEAQVDLLEQAGPSVAVAMCNLVMRWADGRTSTLFHERRLRPSLEIGLWRNVQDVLATRFLFTNQTIAARRGAVNSIGGFNERLWVMEDFDFAMRLSTLGSWAYTVETLAVWNEGTPNSITATAVRDQRRLQSITISIVEDLLAAGVPHTRIARSSLRYMSRRARRALRVLDEEHPGVKARLRAVAIVEEEILERLFRNTPLYPKIEAKPIAT